MNPKVDFYFNKATQWQEEIEKLRYIVLDTGLKETLKWGCPCYQLEDRNIVLIHVFKEYCAVLFFKGVLIKDPHRVLIQQSENVQAARQMRFTNLKEVVEQENVLKNLILEAIEIEKSGEKVVMKKTSEYEVAEEFQKELDKNPHLISAFANLTPGRQRGYHMFFVSAKLSKTREARIEKCIPQIMEGKGLND